MSRKTRRAWKRKKHTLFFVLGHKSCYWCGRGMKYTQATREHIIPRSLGGTNKLANLALSCRECNQRRGDYIANSPKPTQADTKMARLVDKKIAYFCSA